MDHPATLELDHGITLIDSGMNRPGLAACYLMISGDQAAFIETGTTHSVPAMLGALEAAGMTPEQVRYVIPTHVHLDHAGGAGALIRQCPKAELAIHPRGAPHMIDPSRLYAGATEVYGEAAMQRIYGEVVPVPEARVRVMQDGDALSFGDDRTLLFLDTPGHARHHHCIYDERSQGFFSGDTFGISYREFDTEQGAFIMPTTTPVQFDPEAWFTSLERLLAYQPQAMFLTHYGRVTDVPDLAAKLKRAITRYVEIARQHADAENRLQGMRDALFDYTLSGLRTHGCHLDKDELHRLLDMDMDLNAQGLEVWLDRQARQ